MRFDTPKVLQAGLELTDADKRMLLTKQDSENDGWLNAESEGIGRFRPLFSQQGSAVGRRGQVGKTALTTISERISDPDISSDPSMKFGGKSTCGTLLLDTR